jgi:general secretion pathway protein D
MTRRTAGLVHAITIIACMVCAAVLCAPVAAQTPAPAALTDIQIVAQSPAETRLRLTFAPRANSYGAIGTTPDKPALGFALTSRNNSAVAPRGLDGFVRQIDFDQLDTVLVLRFSTAAVAQLAVSKVDVNHIEVTVSGGVQTTAGAVTQSSDPHGAVLPPSAEDGYELVMLRYADVSEVVGLLTNGMTVKSNDSFTPREPSFGSSSMNGNTFTPPPAIASDASDQPLGQSVDANIAVDRRLNAIWLKGSLARIARMKAQIAMIDVPVDSVILETQLIELTESGSTAVGINFANANGQIAVATFQTGGQIPTGYAANSGGHLGAGGTFVGGALSSVALQAAISAQIAKGQGRIVSRPRISALSGSTAKIITGDALPILTSITLSGVNGVSQQVQYVNVGVTLQIAPRVTPDGDVTSHVFCEVSSVSGYSQGYPTISQREAQTSATVHDGDTFVVGGLMQQSTLSSDSKVPLLGDLPLIGGAFHSVSKSRSKTDLYIVITPHVVHMRRALALNADHAGDGTTPNQASAATGTAPALPDAAMTTELIAPGVLVPAPLP